MKHPVLSYAFLFVCLCVIQIPAAFSQQFKVRIVIENVSDEPLEIRMKKGDIYETINPDHNRQNLVLAKDYFVTIEAGKTKTITMEAYCTTQHRMAPGGGERMKATPLRHGLTFDSQYDLWNKISDLSLRDH